MSKKIISIRITAHESVFDPPPEIFVTLDNNEEQKLFSFYPDEISFSEQELVGLTIEQAMQLRHKKDVAYLQS